MQSSRPVSHCVHWQSAPHFIDSSRAASPAESGAAFTHSHPLCSATICLLAAALVMLPASEARACPGDRSPGEPVVSSLHLPHFFPTDPVGVAFPANRDSTDYDTTFQPSFLTGFELFTDTDVYGDRLFVAYNSGFSVWDIAGARAGNPRFLNVREGWVSNHFLNWSNNVEESAFIEEISVLPLGGPGDPDENLVLIALAARDPVGFSAWIFDRSNNDLQQIYQVNDNHSFQVRLIEHTDGRFYAFSSRPDGIKVYDLTRARQIGTCFDDKITPVDECPGVDKGRVGGMTTGRYLDVWQRPANGAIFVSASDGVFGTAVGVELHRVDDPSNPAAATRLLGGLSSRTFGTALFDRGDQIYLAAIERLGNVDNVISFFNVSGCVDGGACSFAQALGEIDLLNFSAAQYLSFSTSAGRPFLYYGGALQNLAQPVVELLLDLSSIHPSVPGQDFAAMEITAGGPTYFDACNGQDVGYWGWYYPKNQFGLKNLSPRRGTFGGEYFYRAAYGVLDVHRFDPSQLEPVIEIFADGFESGTACAWTAPGCP
ncbi:MAG: hypothetical protein MI919_17350 [Holophagales bacterium]|nr:hypothetical protein [Holophagales bacterium]